MNIDKNAPMIASDEIIIEAPIEDVWDLESDINHWPEWQPGVSEAMLEGELLPGNVFRWKGQGLSIVSTLEEVEPPRRIGWTGKAIGIDAIHIWTFESVNGGTRVVTEESWSGWLTRIFKFFDRKMLQKSLQKSLQQLKETAEKV